LERGFGGSLIVDLTEITRLQAQLADYPEAMIALEVLADCEGDLEDAAMTLGIRAGQQPGLDNDDWLAAMAKRCRAALCRAEFRQDLVNGNWATALHFLQTKQVCPGLLAVPILLYADHIGINRFCEPLDVRLDDRP
jgi:hypothetical protein